MNRVEGSFAADRDTSRRLLVGGSAKSTVSVVIRALNERALIGRCLAALREQDGGNGLEIIVVDSGSTDDTCEIARDHRADVVAFNQPQFDYSSALNLGIEHSTGDLVVILSAHSILQEPRWLEIMTQPFDDPLVAGVCCRQVAWPDTDWHEARRIAQNIR